MPYSIATPASDADGAAFRTFATAISDSFQERTSVGPRTDPSAPEGREDHLLDVAGERVVEESVLGRLINDHFSS